MQTLKFSNVVYGVAQLAGLDRDNLPGHFFKQVRDLANTRLAIAWESEYWPELLKTDSLAVTTSSDVSSMTYPAPAGEVLAVYDKDPTKSIHTLEEPVNASDYIFLSVPTPSNSDGSIHLKCYILISTL